MRRDPKRQAEMHKKRVRRKVLARKREPHIPDHLPLYLDQHTYMSTPVFNPRMTDSQDVRKQKLQERKEVICFAQREPEKHDKNSNCVTGPNMKYQMVRGVTIAIKKNLGRAQGEAICSYTKRQRQKKNCIRLFP